MNEFQDDPWWGKGGRYIVDADGKRVPAPADEPAPPAPEPEPQPEQPVKEKRRV